MALTAPCGRPAPPQALLWASRGVTTPLSNTPHPPGGLGFPPAPQTDPCAESPEKRPGRGEGWPPSGHGWAGGQGVDSRQEVTGRRAGAGSRLGASAGQHVPPGALSAGECPAGSGAGRVWTQKMCSEPRSWAGPSGSRALGVPGVTEGPPVPGAWGAAPAGGKGCISAWTGPGTACPSAPGGGGAQGASWPPGPGQHLQLFPRAHVAGWDPGVGARGVCHAERGAPAQLQAAAAMIPFGGFCFSHVITFQSNDEIQQENGHAAGAGARD